MSGFQHIQGQARGQSSYQNHLDHDFDPLVTKPEPKTDWVARSTPRNYLPRQDDLISFNPIHLVKRVVSTVTSALGFGTEVNRQKSQASTFTPDLKKTGVAVGILVNLSAGPADKSAYPKFSKPDFARTGTLGQMDYLKPEFNKMINELNHLEKHLQAQSWYQELAEVFPAKQATAQKQENKRRKHQNKQLQNMAKRREKALEEQGKQKLQELLANTQQQIQQNFRDIQRISKEMAQKKP